MNTIKAIVVAIAIVCVSPFGASALENGHFNVSNLTEQSNVNLEVWKRTLEKKGLEQFAEPLLNGEEQYGINVFGLTAVGALESDWYKKPAGRYNYHGNMGSSGPLNYSSLEHGILASAKNLGIDYLTPKGKFYKGTSLNSINPTYCPTDVNWKYKVGEIANELKDDYNIELENYRAELLTIFEQKKPKKLQREF